MTMARKLSRQGFQESMFSLETPPPAYPPIDAATINAAWTPGEVFPGVHRVDPRVFENLIYAPEGYKRSSGEYLERLPDAAGPDLRLDELGKSGAWFKDWDAGSGRRYIADVAAERPVVISRYPESGTYDENLLELERTIRDGLITEPEYRLHYEALKNMRLQGAFDNGGRPPLPDWKDQWRAARQLNPDIVITDYQRYLATDPRAVQLKEVREYIEPTYMDSKDPEYDWRKPKSRVLHRYPRKSGGIGKSRGTGI